MSRTLLSLAGFQVIISGRFWVIAEDRAGDLLWRENVGWAVCLADVTGRESVEVRLRGEKKKVGAGYYVNIPDLATRNKKLSELLRDLRVRLDSPGQS